MIWDDIGFLLNKNIQNPIFILNEQGTEVCGMNVKSLPTSYPYYKSTFSILTVPGISPYHG